MKKRYGEFLRILSVMLCLALLMPLNVSKSLASTTKNTASETKVKASLHDVGLEQKVKVSPKLDDQYKKDEYVTFILKFKDQADPVKAAAKAESIAKSNKYSIAKAKYAKGSAVLSALRTKANETQQKVLEFLKNQKKSGKVKNYQSFYIVNAIAVTATKDVMDKLTSFMEIDKILPNEIRQLNTTATKKLESQTTSNNNTTGNNDVSWGVDKIGAPSVWSTGIDGTGIVIGSIDTGVQWDHPALMTQYRGYDPSHPDQPNNEYNWFDAVSDSANPADAIGHGTHTVGTMVGREANGTHQIGVAPGAKWIAARAFTGQGGSDTALLAAGQWMLAPTDAAGNPHPEMRPNIINNSWGGGAGLDEWYRPMVQAWRAADIFPVFSAGNQSFSQPNGPGTVAEPANYPESFAVGATDINDKLANFSLQGPSPYGEIKPDVSAPGVNICSSIPGSLYSCGYSGTSMAAPHVAGTVALLLQANSSLSVDQIEHILTSTAVPRTDSNYPTSPNNGYGYGSLSAYNAVSSITKGLGYIKGTVTKDGQDSEAPTYQFTATTQQSYAGFDIPLQIAVQDNVSVRSVKLQYQLDNGDWTDVDAYLTSGDYKNGIYSLKIPGSTTKNILSNTALNYHWVIDDYGHNTLISDPYTLALKPDITTGYFEDFESTPDGWTSYGDNNSWEWGIPTVGPPAAASGSKVYGTNLSGNYASSTNATLVTPPINLPDGSNYLQFKQWYSLENSYDWETIYISTDGQDWYPLSENTGDSNGWVNSEIDLSNYAGQVVYIGFNMWSDSMVEFPGIYLDDVVLSNVSDPTATRLSYGSALTPSPEVLTNDKKSVDPTTIKPTGINLTNTTNQQTIPPQQNVPTTTTTINTLPLSATVSVLETGRSTQTNPVDGSYVLPHAAGTYTVQAEVYGYESQKQTVNVTGTGTTEVNFNLQPTPQETISGTITNQATGEPVANASIVLMEDANIVPVTTDELGHYSITAYKGTYTMHISAEDFYTQDILVTIDGIGSTVKDIQLKPYIDYPGEIGYDDDSYENAHSFYDAGNGWAVKMTLPEGHDKAMVTGGLFKFSGIDFPDPGGTNFQVEVFDASGLDGAPGRLIAGPINATAKRNGLWTLVDLSNKGIQVNSDFYLVYLQTDPYPYCPGLTADESSGSKGHSWQYFNGQWAPVPSNEGNYDIRARVSYEVLPPVITSPADNTYTNKADVVVEGKAAPVVGIHLMNNGLNVADLTTSDTGLFSAPLILQPGDNILTATASTDAATTEPSTPIKVVLDQVNPELTIASPSDGLKTNHEVVTITGTVSDENLDNVKVNGQDATINSDGTYSMRLLLNEGENPINVVAMDKAGNETNQSITISAKFTVPTIQNLLPDQNMYLDTGETVKIEFDSEPGLTASFMLNLPLNSSSMSDNLLSGGLNNQAAIDSLITASPLAMNETTSGHYIGYWTAPSTIEANGATIEVQAIDQYGNVAIATATGLLKINVPNLDPIAVITAPTEGKVNDAITFDGSHSYDPDGGTILDYSWDFGDHQTANGPTITHTFTKKGKYKVHLTVLDDRGSKTTITQQITIKDSKKK